MIYFYKSISPHRIENLHNYLNYYFDQLFNGNHHIYSQLTHIHHDFVDIINEYSDINRKLEAIFNSYQALHASDQQKLQMIYKSNTDIVGICDKKVKPFKFSELPNGIKREIETLYDSNGVLYKLLTHKTAYQLVKDRCGELKTHFEEFRKINEYGVCPFCGMETLLNENDELKNEYDHYISKGDYPFCSINFQNLVPICDYCNKSGNKGRKDIPFIPDTNPQIQEEIYFPYTSNISNHGIKLSIKSQTNDLRSLNSWSLEIDCIPSANKKRLSRWIEIYNIESRYKSKIAKDSKNWRKWIFEEYYTLCKKNNVNFKVFAQNAISRYDDYKNINHGILLKSFYEFILNNPDCENTIMGSF